MHSEIIQQHPTFPFNPIDPLGLRPMNVTAELNMGKSIKFTLKQSIFSIRAKILPYARHKRSIGLRVLE